MARIRTLIVDDSALVRTVITNLLSKDPDIEVVGTASDAYAARDKILALNPDIITLDIEMPRMDGITFLKLIMKHRPMPVIIMSSLTGHGSEKAVEALQAGAVDIMAKPGTTFSAPLNGAELISKIKGAVKAHLRRHEYPIGTQECPDYTPRFVPAPHGVDSDLILIGASTGGIETLKTILTALPTDVAPVCVVQHIPAYFSRAFADRLNKLCRVEVKEAESGDVCSRGTVLIAPGGNHMLLRKKGRTLIVELNEGPLVHHQRPSVDVLFDSAVKVGASANSLGILLTGMGSDGASGLLNLKQNGATTIAQNEESCVVFGMPKEAIKRGAAQYIFPPNQIAQSMVEFSRPVSVC
ncbi:MAG: Chemotaxis response regulator protein-glutamate methylesterase [Verrucomicrobiales bacterium]|nr:Chemotaxis response regulator protein-glutamate methylesterase [Verrucomicrobiales bacterium]